MKSTPSAKARLIREGVITPSVQTRKAPIQENCTPLNKAREKLHVSYLPTILPCRENEYNNIFSFLERKLLDGCGGCMYVSGVPGTGKTATVTDVIRKLEEKSKKGIIPSFQFICINGMKLSEPRQTYVEILKQLSGKVVSWEQAQLALDTKFTKQATKSKPVILLVDELDILCTKRQDVVYNLLDWPTRATVQLVVVTIANTMDLPERLLMGRVTSRLGLTRLTFQAYTYKQLQEIVTMRLMGTKIFNPDAVQLVARKVASVSGDARRALDICRRAVEIAESEGPDTLVSMNHVNEALSAMITQPKVKAIKHCSRLQQLILQATVAEIERTGVEETTISDVYTMFESIATIDGFQNVSYTLALAAVSKLSACRLLLTEQKPNDFHQKLILNVSTDDVYYALKNN
ncbi:putative origin recognition complex subunit [Trypoxylus dichotomus]